MRSSTHDEIRRLLKEFGLSADETVSAYIIETKPSRPLRLRLTLEDLTEYESPPAAPLRVEVEGEVVP